MEILVWIGFLFLVGIRFFWSAKTKRVSFLAAIIAFVGAIGFIGPFFLRHTGDKLKSVEFPAFLDTVTILGPDGRRFALNAPLQRVQRYSANGDFETGWFLDTAGGSAGIGLTDNDFIVIAPIRRRRFDFFMLDGAVARPSVPMSEMRRVEFNRSRPISAGALDETGIQIKPAQQVSNPTPSFTALALFPLWHPILAWLLMVGSLIIGGVIVGPKPAAQSNR
jgi:hypothetical protein